MAGDVDVFVGFPAPENLPQFAADPRFQVLNGNTEGETILAMNNQREPFDNPLVRRAVTHAIDRQAIIDGAQVLKVLGPNVHSSLLDKVLALVPAVFDASVNGGEALQKTSAGALAALAKAVPSKMIANLLAFVVPALEDSGEADTATGKRRGAAAVASALVTDLGPALAPYCVLMLVPLMGRMSDPVPAVREMATKSFASLVPLLPLARGRGYPPELSA